MPVSHPFRMRLVIDLYQGFRAARSTPGYHLSSPSGKTTKSVSTRDFEVAAYLGAHEVNAILFFFAEAIEKAIPRAQTAAG
jgi:hypothetical protein